MSPRRSSRSKTSHPTSVTQQTNSSSSSVSSSRADCRSRSQNKLPSPRNSIAPRSPSSVGYEASNKPRVRRTRSSQEVPRVGDKDVERKDDVDKEDNDEEEEDEITRCVCGQQEYPGMPAATSKRTGDAGDTNSPSTLQEDTGGLFIQCDDCKVWQHGGCVGIMDEATSPEEYYCEKCRKDLHTVTNTITGQTHSMYLPVQEACAPQSPSSPTPQEASPMKAKESRLSRLNPEGSAGKRRSTMNSRDAAYYEAEQLRRAIEESKKDGAVAAGPGLRKGKRTRDESDQPKANTKRQRTESGSSASSNDRRGAEDDAEDETGEPDAAAASSTARNIRGAAPRNQRNKELREREDKREKDRLDAASKRKGRADRRRGDESDPSEEPLFRIISSKGADKASIEPPPGSQAQPPPKSSHHKKTGRPPARRGRVGRNQYTRDRDRPDIPKNAQGSNSPVHSNSSKEGHNALKVNGEIRKQSKIRQINPNRATMNDMKRRVVGILEFIGRTQVEMAAEVPLVPASKSPRSAKEMATAQKAITQPDDEQNAKDSKGSQHEEHHQSMVAAVNARLDLDEFQRLGSLEMMEVLTRKLMKWQGEFGKLGDK